LHKDIQNFSSESSRTCWENMLELIALSSGWDTTTNQSQHLWDKFAPDPRWSEYFQCWNAEVDYAHDNGGPFSEPFGELLEEVEATNENLGQFFTPMTVVRMMNEMTLPGSYVPSHPDGSPGRTGMDPCCGTGRFILDALVHDDGVHMCGIELDLWLFRAAMVNARLLPKYSSLRLTPGAGGMKAFKSAEDEDEAPGLLLLGGKATFMNADALVVDTGYRPNWMYPLYEWTPLPWQSSLKIEGFDGSLEEYERQGCPERFKPAEPPPQVRFDYSMTDQPGPNP
jgi:hypothetical protein